MQSTVCKKCIQFNGLVAAVRASFNSIDAQTRPSVGSEAESLLGVSEQRPKTRPIKAQSTAIACAMARICNAERVRFGVVSGHERKTLSLSAPAVVSRKP
jgi:hypothetical protein